MSFKIADLFADLNLDTGSFDRDLDRALAGAKTKVKGIDVQLAVDDSQIRAAQGSIGKLSDTKVNIKPAVDDSAVTKAAGSITDKLKTAGSKGGDAISDSLKRSGGTAGEAGSRMGGDIVGGLSEKVSVVGSKAGPIGLALAAAAGLGLGVGALIVNQLRKGMESNSAKFDFAAATGMTPARAAKFASAAGEAYAKNFGESVSGNLDTARTALQAGLFDKRATQTEIEAVVSQLSQVSDTLGLDIPEAAKAAGQMVKTGFARNATEAFDTIVKGAQLGLNANDDLLDTLNEYTVQFQKLGFNGGQALGIINDLVKGGARNTDLAADALKEFSIRAVDGSKTSAQAFEALNLNAKSLTDQFARGGPSARKAFAQVVGAIQSVEDPAKRSQIQVALFGTQAEDLGAALNKIDPKNLVRTAGATQKLIDTVGQDPAAKVEQAQRAVGVAVAGIRGAAAEAFAPYISRFADYVSSNRVAVIGFLADSGRAVFNFAADGLDATGTLIDGLGGLAASFFDVEASVLRLAPEVLKLGAAGALASGQFGLAKQLFEASNNAKGLSVDVQKAGLATLVGMDKASAGAHNAADGLRVARDRYTQLTDKLKNDAAVSDATARLGKGFVKLKDNIGSVAGSSNRLAAAEKVLNDRHSVQRGLLDKVNRQFGAQYLATVKARGSQKDLNAITGSYQGQLTGVFRKMGLNKDQAQKLAEKYSRIPKDVKTQVTQPGMAKSISDAGTLYGKLAVFNGKTFSTKVAVSYKGRAGGSYNSGNDLAKATGGSIVGPGSGTSDSIPAMLSNGEHVWTAKEVAKAGGQSAMYAMRAAVRNGTMPGFASGGAVKVNTTSRGAGGVMSGVIGVLHAVGRAAQAAALAAQQAAAAARSGGGGSFSGAGKGGVKGFIRAQLGKPYSQVINNGVGPSAYDCSGIVSAVINVMRGQNPHRRLFTTGSIGPGVAGVKPGFGGTLNIGVTSGKGHMAGNYAGMPFEASRPGVGLRSAGATSVGSFARHFHLARGGEVSATKVGQLERKLGYRLGGDAANIELPDGTNINAATGRLSKAKAWGTFDTGGILKAGQSGTNKSGKPERVLSPRQTKAFEALVKIIGVDHGKKDKTGLPSSVFNALRAGNLTVKAFAAEMKKFGEHYNASMGKLVALIRAGGPAAQRAVFRARSEKTVRDYANGIPLRTPGATIIKQLRPMIKKYMAGKTEKAFLARLTHLSNRADATIAVQKSLNQAIAKRDAIKAQRGEFRSGLAAYGPNIGDYGSSKGGILGGLTGQLGAVKKLVANIRTMKQQGYPLELINQIVGLSLSDAVNASNQLIGLSAADRTGVIGTFGQLTSLTTAGGTQLSNELYGSGLEAANGVIAGLKKKQADIDARFEKAAIAMGRALAKQLKVNLDPKGTKSLAGAIKGAAAKPAKGGGKKSGGGASGGGKAAGGGNGGGGTGALPHGHLGPAAAKGVARRLLPKGWSFAALETLWNRESGWRWNADNPHSSAYGIPQALPGSKMGKGWHDDATAQIRWGLGYIRNRYGNASNALAHSNRTGWYDRGGWLETGRTLTQNNTGKPEAVLTAEQWAQQARTNALLEKLVAAGGRQAAPLIGHADIHHEVDLARYDRLRAFHDRRTRV